MNQRFKLELPRPAGNNEEIETERSFLIVGANGSGKSRLGAWIEQNHPNRNKVHRISAQKSLAMPNSSTPTSLRRAEMDLWFGRPEEREGREWNSRHGNRWGGNPVVSPLNDFEKLMVYLFSEQTELVKKYHEDSRASTGKIPPYLTKLDSLKDTWEKVFPHRKLILGGLDISVAEVGGSETVYKASEMSDGERVAFYLIGQSLAAPSDGVLIIDEPELHLHKSIQIPLWREIHNMRSDCLFIYMTHDLNFAASLPCTQRIWLQKYYDEKWDWKLIEPIDGLPEDLLVEVLGSRRPVVFVEGVKGGYDESLYRAALPDFLVIPLGSCHQVIQSVKALRVNSELHHNNVFGVIDRDRRVSAEMRSLESDGVYTLEVAEVENLFCVPELLRIVCQQMGREFDEIYDGVLELVFARFSEEIDHQIALRVRSEIEHQLSQTGDKLKSNDFDGLKEWYVLTTGRICVESIYSETSLLLNKVLADRDYRELLRIYNRKSLVKQIGHKLNLRGDELLRMIVRLAAGQCANEIAAAIRPYFGGLEEHIKSLSSRDGNQAVS